MARYIARIELSDELDYTLLDAAVRAYGFSRLVANRDGEIFKLPSGTYWIETELSMTEVHDRAVAAAARTGQRYSLLVSKNHVVSWVGLARHNPADLD
jgi:hypothetical protein